MITSLQNPRVKQAAHLRDGKSRRAAGRFVIDGAREILRAFHSGIEITELYCCEKLCKTTESKEALEEIAASRAGAGSSTRSRVELIEVSESVFEKLAFGERTEGLFAVAVTPTRTLDDFSGIDAKSPLCVIAGVEKPGNVGAVMRSADGAGVGGVIVAGAGTDLFNPHAIRSSMGTIFKLPCCAADETATRDWLISKGRTIYAAWVDDAAIDYTKADFTKPCAIVLGSEATGLGDVWRHDSSKQIIPIKLPMLGIADSLNVSTAAAVLFYEALRQRTIK